MRLGAGFLLMLLFSVGAAAQTPTIAGVANQATNTTVLAAGSLASLYGANLTSSATPCTAAGGAAWTTTFCNSQVMVGATLAPLEYVSASQINFQVPYGLGTGPVSVVAVNQLNRSASFTIQLSAFAPLIVPSGIVDSKGAGITTGNPAVVSAALSVYCEGLGVTNPAVAAGTPAPGPNPLANTVATPVILIDGAVQIQPLSSVLAPGQVGLYQVNFIVPALSPGSHTVALQIGGITSSTMPFPVAPLPFFQSEVSLGNGVYYEQFPDTNPFGYYNYVANSIFYHYDMGYEAFVPGTGADIYLYDFATQHWLYTSASLFPYLYDFTLTNWLYYFPDTNNAGHYTANPRYFSNLTTGKIISM